MSITYLFDLKEGEKLGWIILAKISQCDKNKCFKTNRAFLNI
jgi:hypothetical protein